jgi:hypothetical protein
MLCKRKAARSIHANLDGMTPSFGQGSDHAGQIVDGSIAVANKEYTRAGIGAGRTRAVWKT